LSEGRWLLQATASKSQRRSVPTPIMVNRAHRTLLALVLAACWRQPSPSHNTWPDAVPLTPVERTAVGCYRVHGPTGPDTVITGWFPPDSILRLDGAVLGVTVPPQGPAIREYVNQHPFWPQPPDFETVWWVGHDGTLHLEWRTPRRTSTVYFYGGGGADLRASGDSLIGETREFRDTSPLTHHGVILKRLPQCPNDVRLSEPRPSAG
jgi:hypothetical protein